MINIVFLFWLKTGIFHKSKINLKKNDTFVLDRGFRDCVDELKENYHLNVKMPALLAMNENSMSGRSD